MRNLLQKKLDKKGFTLAELLIVVAIIAVLVAIAVPLYRGALDKAEETAFNANQRSIKAAGIAVILSDNTYTLKDSDELYAYATLTNGNLSEVNVVANKVPTGAQSWDDWKDDKTQAIVAKIEQTELSSKVDTTP